MLFSYDVVNNYTKENVIKGQKDWVIDKTGEYSTAFDFETSYSYFKAALTKYSENGHEVNRTLCEHLLIDLNKMVDYFMIQNKYEYR